MSAIRFDFAVPGDQARQISTSIGRVGLVVKDLRPAWAKIHAELREIQEAQFASEGRRGSGGWAPLSKDYAERKRLKWGQRPILQASRRMRDAYTEPNHPDHVEVSSPLEMRFGVSERGGLDYAKHHQSGTRHMPARKPLELTAADRRKIEGIVVEAVRDAVIAARRGGA